MVENKSTKSLSKDFTAAFDEQELCDVFFSVEGKTIGAHKLVLKFRSRHLFEMASGWSHGNPPISIEDMTYETFNAILRCMYSGQTVISNANVFTHLAASVQFKMDSLEELCVDHIIKFMSTENVFIFMNEAVNFNSVLLKKKCSQMFSKETFSIASEDAFMKLSQPALSALLDSNEIDLLEKQLFLYIREWMEQQCQDQGLPVNGTNMRHVIGDALYKIRFPTMNVQDFANYVTTIKGLLTESEMAQIFQKITVCDGESIACLFSDKFRCNCKVNYTLSFVIEKLLYTSLVQSMNIDAEDLINCSPALNLIKKAKDGEHIGRPMHSFHFISQCIADLANSSPYLNMPFASSQNQVTRNDIYEGFLIWQDVAKTRNVSDIMTRFKQLCKKIYQLISG